MNRYLRAVLFYLDKNFFMFLTLDTASRSPQRNVKFALG